jgi:hypothetical protein
MFAKISDNKIANAVKKHREFDKESIKQILDIVSKPKETK